MSAYHSLKTLQQVKPSQQPVVHAEPQTQSEDCEDTRSIASDDTSSSKSESMLAILELGEIIEQKRAEQRGQTQLDSLPSSAQKKLDQSR